MNSEERDIITRFIARVGGGQSGFNSSSVSLPPIDPEADRFIGENFARYPEARYRVTQLAVVQEAALAQAQNRIRDLEFQLQQTKSQIAQLQQQASSQKSGGFFSSIFGGHTAQPSRPASFAPPGWNGAPQQPPMGYGQAAPQPGMFGNSGSGFLGSALTTAAGVAGGIMAADALESLFSGHHGHDSASHDLGSGMVDSGNETVINNYYGDTPSGSDPFSGGGMNTDGFSSNDFDDASSLRRDDWGSSSDSFDGFDSDF